ncbi:hypothetical protein cypCar_00014431 [Cyprinus carpio]|nr:hypothetical protein cypCar_00014431 [Cyprinus carpio]
MDMSQRSSTANAQKVSAENYYALNTPGVPKSYSPYFSLPRSYKAPSRDQVEHDDYVPMSSPAKPTAVPFGRTAFPWEGEVCTALCEQEKCQCVLPALENTLILNLGIGPQILPVRRLLTAPPQHKALTGSRASLRCHKIT